MLEHSFCFGCTSCLISLASLSVMHWKVRQCVSDTMYLKDQHSRVCDSQVDPHSLTVVCGVGSDAVHVQLPGHLQQVDVRLSWRQTPEHTDGRTQWLGVAANSKPSPHRAERAVCAYLCFL